MVFETKLRYARFRSDVTFRFENMPNTFPNLNRGTLQFQYLQFRVLGRNFFLSFKILYNMRVVVLCMIQ